MHTDKSKGQRSFFDAPQVAKMH